MINLQLFEYWLLVLMKQQQFLWESSFSLLGVYLHLLEVGLHENSALRLQVFTDDEAAKFSTDRLNDRTAWNVHKRYHKSQYSEFIFYSWIRILTEQSFLIINIVLINPNLSKYFFSIGSKNILMGEKVLFIIFRIFIFIEVKFWWMKANSYHRIKFSKFYFHYLHRVI